MGRWGKAKAAAITAGDPVGSFGSRASGSNRHAPSSRGSSHGSANPTYRNAPVAAVTSSRLDLRPHRPGLAEPLPGPGPEPEPPSAWCREEAVGRLGQADSFADSSSADFTAASGDYAASQRAGASAPAQPAPLAGDAELQLKDIKLYELKQLCREAGLPEEGLRAQLINRLIADDVNQNSRHVPRTHSRGLVLRDAPSA